MDNPEKLATLVTQDTDEDQQNKNTTQKLKKMSNTDPTKIMGDGPRCSLKLSNNRI